MQGGKLDAVALRSRLYAIFISEIEGVHKPDAEMFRRAATRLDAVPSQCVFVGDNPDADIQGAKGSGMRAICIRDTWWDEPRDADAVIDRVPELLPLVESWQA